MREILFRGKRVDNGEWVGGGITFATDGTPYICPTRFSDYDEEIEVVPKTVGEYTGLCDKKGKKIFEGDILLIDVEKEATPKSKDRHITKASVEFQLGGFTLGGGELVLFTYYGLKYLFKPSSFDNYEIIGNIHDNPEVFGVVPPNKGETEQ